MRKEAQSQIAEHSIGELNWMLSRLKWISKTCYCYSSHKEVPIPSSPKEWEKFELKLPCNDCLSFFFFHQLILTGAIYGSVSSSKELLAIVFCFFLFWFFFSVLTCNCHSNKVKKGLKGDKTQRRKEARENWRIWTQIENEKLENVGNSSKMVKPRRSIPFTSPFKGSVDCLVDGWCFL